MIFSFYIEKSLLLFFAFPLRLHAVLITMPSQTFTRKVAIYETGNQGRNLQAIGNFDRRS